MKKLSGNELTEYMANLMKKTDCTVSDVWLLANEQRSMKQKGIPSGRAGCTASDETKAKMSASHRAREITDEERAIISNRSRDRVITEETRAKQRLASKDRNLGRTYPFKQAQYDFFDKHIGCTLAEMTKLFDDEFHFACSRCAARAIAKKKNHTWPKAKKRITKVTMQRIEFFKKHITKEMTIKEMKALFKDEFNSLDYGKHVRDIAKQLNHTWPPK